MKDINARLAEILNKAKVEVSEKEKEIIVLLLRHRYGLYASEIAKNTGFLEDLVRRTLRRLSEKGILESKQITSIDAKSFSQGYRLRIPEGYRIMSSSGQEVPFKKGEEARISGTDLVIDEDGFRVPFRRKFGSTKSVVYKIS